jgi:hypothetical protein
VDPAIFGNLLGWTAAIVITAAGGLWFQRMNQVRIPRDRTAFFAAFGLGLALGVGAFAVGTDWLGGLAAGYAIAGSAIFLGLRLQSTQADAPPTVAVGRPVVSFSAPDADGREFDLSSLAGRPFLLKFFRGHW